VRNNIKLLTAFIMASAISTTVMAADAAARADAVKPKAAYAMALERAKATREKPASSEVRSEGIVAERLAAIKAEKVARERAEGDRLAAVAAHKASAHTPVTPGSKVAAARDSYKAPGSSYSHGAGGKKAAVSAASPAAAADAGLVRRGSSSSVPSSMPVSAAAAPAG
jgi:hypothetical protein